MPAGRGLLAGGGKVHPTSWKNVDCSGQPDDAPGKKMVAARDLPTGHMISREDIAFKSPGDGLPPYDIDKVIGRVTNAAMQEDDAITFEALNGSEHLAKAAS